MATKMRRRKSRRASVRSTLRNAVRRKRRNPVSRKAAYRRGKIRRPRVVSYGRSYYATPKARLLTPGTRINKRRRRKTRRNPVRARRYAYRRNPVKTMTRIFSQRNLMLAAKTAGGLALGYMSVPISSHLMHMVGIKGQDKFAGVGSIIMGGLIVGMVKNKDLKDMGIVVAGVGMYDLITQNMDIGLPRLPRTTELTSRMLPPGNGDELSSSYSTGARSGYGASYPVPRLPMSPAASLAANYMDPAMTTQGLGCDTESSDEFIGHIPGIDW